MRRQLRIVHQNSLSQRWQSSLVVVGRCDPTSSSHASALREPRRRSLRGERGNRRQLARAQSVLVSSHPWPKCPVAAQITAFDGAGRDGWPTRPESGTAEESKECRCDYRTITRSRRGSRLLTGAESSRYTSSSFISPSTMCSKTWTVTPSLSLAINRLQMPVTR